MPKNNMLFRFTEQLILNNVAILQAERYVYYAGAFAGIYISEVNDIMFSNVEVFNQNFTYSEEFVEHSKNLEKGFSVVTISGFKSLRIKESKFN